MPGGEAHAIEVKYLGVASPTFATYSLGLEPMWSRRQLPAERYCQNPVPSLTPATVLVERPCTRGADCYGLTR